MAVCSVAHKNFISLNFEVHEKGLGTHGTQSKMKKEPRRKGWTKLKEEGPGANKGVGIGNMRLTTRNVATCLCICFCSFAAFFLLLSFFLYRPKHQISAHMLGINQYFERYNSRGFQYWFTNQYNKYWPIWYCIDQFAKNF